MLKYIVFASEKRCQTMVFRVKCWHGKSKQNFLKIFEINNFNRFYLFLKIFEISRHVLYLYEMWKTYDEKEQIKELLGKIQKPRLTPTASSRPQQQENQ